MEISQHKVNNKQYKFGEFKNFFAKFSKKSFILPVWRGNNKDLPLEAFVFEKKLKLPKKLAISMIIAVLFNFVGFFTPVLAAEAVMEAKIATEQLTAPNGIVLPEDEIELIQQDLVVIEHLPAIDELNFVDQGIRVITAYNSEKGQTDDTPCITANGFNVCEHGIEDTIAANFLKFGTKVRIPELFGDKIFVVRDRMNQRYPNRVDVWMQEKSHAQTFGVKQASIQVILE